MASATEAVEVVVAEEVSAEGVIEEAEAAGEEHQEVVEVIEAAEAASQA